jgi:hypothetical protein
MLMVIWPLEKSNCWTDKLTDVQRGDVTTQFEDDVERRYQERQRLMI